MEYSDNYNDYDNDHDKEHPDVDCNDDVGNWRDNDSEEEEEEREESDNDDESEEEDSEEDDDEDDVDTPNFRNSISPKSKKANYGFADKNIALKTKKKSSSEKQGQSTVGPVPGSIWKLLAPSSDDVSVGEM